MAEALGLSNSQLSRLLSLAQMPDEVVNAFATREDLRVRHSEVLTPLLRRPEQRGLLLAAAGEVSSEQQLRATRNEKMIPAATVLARLKQAASTDPVEYDRGGPIVVAGEPIGRIKALKTGSLAVEFAIAPATQLDDILAELREAIEIARGVGRMQNEEA
jgi:ParB family chromosome partitioning protein